MKEFVTIYLRDIKEAVMQDALRKSLIQNYLKHLPIKGIVEGWDDEVYELSNQCVIEMYKYAVQKDYIDKDVAVDNFIQIALLWDKD